MNFLLYEGKKSLEDVFYASKILTGAIHLVDNEIEILPRSLDEFFNLCDPGLITEFLAELVYTHPDTPALEPIMQFIFCDDHVHDETLTYSIKIMKGIVFKNPSRIEYFMHNKKDGSTRSFLTDLLDSMGDTDEFSSEFMEIFSECLIKQCNNIDELIELLFEYQFIEFAFELLSQDYVLDKRKYKAAQFLVSCCQNSSLHDEVMKNIRQRRYIGLCHYLSSCPSILKEPLLMIISHVIKNDGYLAMIYLVENNILENLEDLIEVCPSVTITCLESIFQYSAEGFFRGEINEKISQSNILSKLDDVTLPNEDDQEKLEQFLNKYHDVDKSDKNSSPSKNEEDTFSEIHSITLNLYSINKTVLYK